MTTAEWLGYAAGFCTTASFVPQVLKVWRTRETRDISTTMYVVFLLGLMLWLGYGLLLGAWPVIIFNSLTIVLAGWVLIMKLRYDRGPP